MARYPSVFSILQIAHFRILEQTPTTFTFRFDYSELMVILYGFMALFGVPFALIGGWFVIQSLSYQWFSPFIALLCCIPLVILIWFLQTIGFHETWQFDRVHKQFTIRRQLAMGQSFTQFSHRAIIAIHVSTYRHHQHLYCIRLESAASVSLDLTHHKMGDRILYVTPEVSDAEAIAEQLRYYLDMIPNANESILLQPPSTSP